MRIRDFERAMPSSVKIDSFKCLLGEVLICRAHVGSQKLLFDTNGKAYDVSEGTIAEGCVAYFDEDVAGVVACKTNRPMPAFDLHFDDHVCRC
ncbi:MAG: hypothetical protein IJ693_05990 [Bacteroidaceae bacterium]|nr:hypothetical protein [Bacteroidaceae bacterium]